MLFFVCLLGAAAVLIQFVSIRRALSSKNYWHVKKSFFDLGADGIIFLIAVNGGVIGFYIAVMASFIITMYLNYFTDVDFNRPEPRFWVIGRSLFQRLTKNL